MARVLEPMIEKRRCDICLLPVDIRQEIEQRLRGAAGDPSASPPITPMLRQTCGEIVRWLESLDFYATEIQIRRHERHLESGEIAPSTADPAVLVETRTRRKANVRTLDEATAAVFDAVKAVARQVQMNGGAATFAQASLLQGGLRAIAVAATTRNAIVRGGAFGKGLPGAGAGVDRGAVRLLRQLARDAEPEPIEGDAGDDDGPLEALPLDHEGVPDDGFDREIIDAPPEDMAPDSSERGPGPVVPVIPSWLRRQSSNE